MVEAVLLVVRIPLPRSIWPVPESVSAPARLMPPDSAAVIVPWQFTGSLIAPQPPKPFPAGTTSCPRGMGQIESAVARDSGRKVESGGNDEQGVGTHGNVVDLRFNK